MSTTSRQERAIDLDSLPDLLGFQLRLAQVAVFRDFVETMGELDVTPGVYAVLVLIHANPGLKQSELARAVRLDRSTIVPLIDGLERRALVRRRVVAHDRRSNALELTPEGAALLKTLRRRVAGHERRLARDLDPAERASLSALLQRIFPEHR